MVDRFELARTRMLKAPTAADISAAIAALGFEFTVWMQWRSTSVLLWDGLPDGFFEHYFGVEAETGCPIRRAIAANMPSFSFGEAAAEFAAAPRSREAVRLWRAFGINDGFVVMSSPLSRAPAALGAFTGRTDVRLPEELREILGLAALRMARLATEDGARLREIARVRVRLSPAQQAALDVQIYHPELTLAEQAARLGVAPRTLVARHREIAQRFDVSSFAGAVAVARSMA